MTYWHFRSELHLEQLKVRELNDEHMEFRSKCKILLLFSKDGVEEAEEFVRIANTVESAVKS